jgi:hypothetical protein
MKTKDSFCINRIGIYAHRNILSARNLSVDVTKLFFGLLLCFKCIVNILLMLLRFL